MSNRLLCPSHGDGILSCNSSRTACGTLCSAAFFLELHPLADEIWAGHDSELPPFPADEIGERDPIQFFEMSHIEQGPQAAVDCRGDELIQIREMPFGQAAGDANRNRWRDWLCRRIAHRGIADPRTVNRRIANHGSTLSEIFVRDLTLS